LEKRIERKGLRPRDAAHLIAAFWALAVLAFGVVERLVDPKLQAVKAELDRLRLTTGSDDSA
jgi:hypothetical protein